MACCDQHVDELDKNKGSDDSTESVDQQVAAQDGDRGEGPEF